MKLKRDQAVVPALSFTSVKVTQNLQSGQARGCSTPIHAAPGWPIAAADNDTRAIKSAVYLSGIEIAILYDVIMTSSRTGQTARSRQRRPGHRRDSRPSRRACESTASGVVLNSIARVLRDAPSAQCWRSRAVCSGDHSSPQRLRSRRCTMRRLRRSPPVAVQPIGRTVADAALAA